MDEITSTELVPEDPFEIPDDPSKIPVGIRANMAFELRKVGAPYDLIARKLGYQNAKTCEQSIRRVLAKKYQPDDVEHVVHMELARLDALQLVAWRRAREGDLAAIDRVLKIMERRAQYLGLDTKTESSANGVTNNTAIFIGGTEEEYIDKLKQARTAAVAAISA